MVGEMHLLCCRKYIMYGCKLSHLMHVYVLCLCIIVHLYACDVFVCCEVLSRDFSSLQQK